VHRHKQQRSGTEFKNRVRGARNAWSAATQWRHTLELKDVESTFTWLSTVPKYRDSYFQAHFPTNYLACRPFTKPQQSSLEFEARWIEAIVHLFSPQISHFRALADSYEESYLKENFSECVENLNEIERLFGISIWLIENRINLLQATEGLAAQKHFSQSAINKSRHRSILPFLIHNISRRNEDAVGIFSFRRQINSLIDGLTLPGGLANYLLFHLINSSPETPSEYAEILNWETSGSAIDLYETFTTLSQYAATRNDGTSFARMAPSVHRIYETTKDGRLSRSLFLQKDIDISELSRTTQRLSHSNTAYYAYRSGLYTESLTTSQLELTKNPYNFSCRILAAASRVQSGTPLSELPPNTFTSIDSALEHILARGDTYDAALLRLFKISANCKKLQWGAALEQFAWGEVTGDLEQLCGFERARFVCSPSLEPDLTYILPYQARAEYSRLFPPHTSTERDKSTPCPEAQSCNPRCLEAKLLDGSTCSDAMPHLAAIARGHDPILRPRATRALARYFLDSGKIDLLIELLVDSYLSSPSNRHLFPLDTIHSCLTGDVKKKIARNINLPIALDILVRAAISDDDDVHADQLLADRRYAYEDFLYSNGASKPSDLVESPNDFENRRIIYFLKNICVQEIMDLSESFASSEEILEERISVCSSLINIDKENSKEYQDEVLSITTHRNIQRGVKLLDQSRIYVDTADLKRWADKELREGFNRFKAFSRAGIGESQSNDKFETLLTKAAQNPSEPLPKELFDVPSNEPDQIISQIYNQLADAFLTNKPYGLDSYLSLRIRHGTLEGLLRAPLDKEGLEPFRAGAVPDTPRYPKWAQRFAWMSGEHFGQIVSALEKFDHSFNEIILELKDKYIQIRSPSKPQGVIGVPRNGFVINSCRVSANESETFDRFIDRNIDFLWILLTPSLNSMKALIEKNIQPLFSRTFQQLQEDLNKISMNGHITELTEAVKRAAMGTQRALDVTKEWFELVDSRSKSTLAVADAINIGVESFQSIMRGHMPKITYDIDAGRGIESEVAFMADNLFIILDNAVKHSGMGEDLEIIISLKRSGNEELILRVENTIGENVQTAETEQKLAQIRSALNDGTSLANVAQEGGTGFFKIQRVVGTRKDISNLDFGFCDDKHFFVEILFTIQPGAT